MDCLCLSEIIANKQLVKLIKNNYVGAADLFYSNEYHIYYYNGKVYKHAQLADKTPDIICSQFEQFCKTYNGLYTLEQDGTHINQLHTDKEYLYIIYDNYLNVAVAYEDTYIIIVNNFMAELSISTLLKYSTDEYYYMCDVSVISGLVGGMKSLIKYVYSAGKSNIDEYINAKVNNVLLSIIGNLRKAKFIGSHIDADIAVALKHSKTKKINAGDNTIAADHADVEISNPSILPNGSTPHLSFDIDGAISACEERMLKYTTHIEKLKSLKLEFIKLQTETTQLLS